jgi:diaminopimelate epimerase
MRKIPFVKMDGLGNDFMIIDERKKSYKLTAENIVRLANRKTGVGFDQMIILRKPSDPKLHAAKMVIFNADGSSAGACGNGARCVGKLLLDEKKAQSLKIEAPHDRVLEVFKGEQITVNMGKPKTAWNDIPLAKSTDTLSVVGIVDDLPLPVAVNVGNPHAVFFVKEVMSLDITKFGPIIENHEMFPERTNVEFAEILAPDHIRMRVWERGAGVTAACGTGASATLVAAVRKGLSNREAKIEMDGGTLTISWTWEGDVLMTGDTNMAFEGTAFL